VGTRVRAAHTLTALPIEGPTGTRGVDVGRGKPAVTSPLIPLGKLVNVHATRGELRMLPFNPDTTALEAGRDVFLRRGSEQCRHRLRSTRRHKRFLLLTLEGCDSMTAAEQLVGCEVCLYEADLPLPGPDEIYLYQLLGMTVVTTGGDRVGTVADAFDTPSNTVCVVRSEDHEYLIPLIADVVTAIDRDGRCLVIEPLPGLLVP
jgi:16S rRNA processing protein RimM